jgi:hypothetical protein
MPSGALLATSAVWIIIACVPPRTNPPVTEGRVLVGTWSLLSVENRLSDGRRIHPYGIDPVGRLTLDPEGAYSVHIFRRSRPRFASGDKTRGSGEENQALVQGTNSHFGRYVSDAQTITFEIQHASFPNWEGTTQRRNYLLDGDTLRYTVTTTTSGGSEVAEVSWVRIR